MSSIRITKANLDRDGQVLSKVEAEINHPQIGIEKLKEEVLDILKKVEDSK